ncbi:MAG TPA: glycosyl hydrolase family 18 protein [Alloacidobacterium sp.]|nr:glycosyl hydrolase family 18 protein [Alloacidobacterium sp.]
MKAYTFFLAIAFSVFTLHAQQPKSLFYLTRSPDGVRSFYAHEDKIDILVPTWYNVDADGLVSGGADPMVLEAAKQHHIPVMPIVADAGFNQPDFHKLITTPQAWHKMIDQLIAACKENGYSGFQFDFENVFWTDRDALTEVVAESATAFHHQGLQLSIATVPNAPGAPGQTEFSAWIYANWRGAYDLKALAQSVDLICLMTYDQHTRWTAPGPVAGWGWTTENLDYALKVVPKEKLSLGIPLYGYHWFAGPPQNDKPNPSAEYIGGQDALDLAKAYGGKIEWDPVDRTAWTYFYRDDMREWIFFTDERTFRERYDLVRERGLQGFCSWVLGQEDPSIWNVLPSHK